MAPFSDPYLEHAIGGTPIVQLKNLAPSSGQVWVKIESGNPTGSYKDRMAYGVVKNAFARGDLKTGDRMVEYTCLLYTSPSPRDVEESRMPSSA